MQLARLQTGSQFPHRIIAQDVPCRITREQGALLFLAEYRGSIQIAIRSVQSDMAQEVSSLHAFGHASTDSPHHGAQRSGDVSVAAFFLFDQVPVVTGKELIAAIT